jgi:hypothetical protein
VEGPSLNDVLENFVAKFLILIANTKSKSYPTPSPADALKISSEGCQRNVEILRKQVAVKIFFFQLLIGATHQLTAETNTFH